MIGLLWHEVRREEDDVSCLVLATWIDADGEKGEANGNDLRSDSSSRKADLVDNRSNSRHWLNK